MLSPERTSNKSFTCKILGVHFNEVIAASPNEYAGGNMVDDTGEISMDQIFKGRVGRVKKFRFYFKDREDSVADLSKAMYDQSGKV